MMIKSGRWILVSSLVSILMMAGLGLAMGKKVEKEEATVQVEVEQKQFEPEQKEEEKVEKATGRKTEKGEKKEELKLELIWEKEFDQITNVGFIPSSGLLEGAKKASEVAPVLGFALVQTSCFALAKSTISLLATGSCAIIGQSHLSISNHQTTLLSICILYLLIVNQDCPEIALIPDMKARGL
ncbi:MAG: hypothetical protein QME81_18020 [bacterium]|nr:hypothetical protein [bacterium]